MDIHEYDHDMMIMHMLHNGHGHSVALFGREINICNTVITPFTGEGRVVSYPDPNVRKHYRLQYNTAYIGSGQQVEESCSWNVIGMVDNLGCHSNGYVITIKREVCFSVF